MAAVPKVEATAPSAVADQGDQGLPDATSEAKLVLAALLLAGIGLSILANAAGWTARPFHPAAAKSAEFGLFAGFYVAAQVIERLMELVAPFLPWPGWKAPSQATGLAQDKDKATVASAYLKADRAVVALGVTTLLGIVASFLFGLYFLQAVGISSSNTVDVFVSGLTIGAGTKPLHDLISSLQNKNTPTTGTTTNAK